MRVSLKYVLIYMYTHIYPHSINMVCMNIFEVFTQTFAEFKHEKITTTETNFLSSPWLDVYCLQMITAKNPYYYYYTHTHTQIVIFNLLS